jgi:Ca-activated chloride channel homolog
MSFDAPQMLWLLLVIPPALVAFFWWSWRKRQKLLTQFIHARLLPGLIVGVSPAREKIRLGCLVLAVVSVILALARPQWGFDWEETRQRGLDIVVAIDTSKSMLAEDIAPNRLARAKLAALDLMKQAKSDRLGLVAFAGAAFLQCPLTVDDSAFRQSVEALNVNTIPEGGTAIAEAIETASAAFKEGENHKVLVLFTDGEDQDSGALDAAKKAAATGMRIFTIGIGSAEGELIRITDANGHADFIRDEQGNVVKSHLNEALLQEIAGAANGFYLPLRGATTIDTLYEKGLAPLPKTESATKLVKRLHEHYHWPLAAAIALLLVEMFFPERRQKSKSAALASRSRLVEAAAIFILLILPAAGFGSSTGSALREYRAGNFDEALKDYQQLLQRKSGDPRLNFNAGTAAYRNRQFDEATKFFDQAIAAPDLTLQELGYYNRGNALYQLGDKNPDPAKKTESWENALKDYEIAQKLAPQDADAKFNYEFVKKKLEELKKQQQQQQQSQQNQSKQDQNQNQNQQQHNQQNEQSKNEQQQKSQSQQNQEQKQDSSQQQQQQQAQNRKEQEQQKQAQANQSGQQKESEKSDEDQKAAATHAGQMTPQQAQQLLDALKDNEMLLPANPTNKQPINPSHPIRDW